MKSVTVYRSRSVAARNLLTTGDSVHMIEAAPVSITTIVES